MSTEYEAAMLARLRASRTEASRVVLDLYKSGRRMDDAVLDAIESMPRSKTVQLRRWSDNWQAWLRWMAFEEHGWYMRIDGSTINVSFKGPNKGGLTVGDVQSIQESNARPRPEDVAAGADVERVQHIGSYMDNTFHQYLTRGRSA